jgi:hypothetical protein
VGFEPTTPASERPQTHPLERAVTELFINLVIYLAEWVRNSYLFPIVCIKTLILAIIYTVIYPLLL